MRTDVQLSFTTLFYATASLIVVNVLTNVAKQLIPALRNRHHPPVVFHWIPKLASTIDYGQDPYAFFFRCRKKYGDCFTFGLLGMKVTVFLGPIGNNLILNGKHKDLNAEEVYGPLTIPIFGPGVVYDIDNARFMEQKRMLKDGFAHGKLAAFVPQFVYETKLFVDTNPLFKGNTGVVDVSSVLSEITLYTAAGSLQGKEVRESFDASFATLYRHLDDAFAPINFMFPGLPIPINRRRDYAQKAMANLYLDIIRKRREVGNAENAQDMIWALMDAQYKDGSVISDPELANLMIAILMGGQHNTAASGTWIMLHLANRPGLIQELFTEQQSVLNGAELTYEHLLQLTLHNNVIKETLRLHSPIHSVMRKVKRTIHVPESDMVIPEGHVLLAAPGLPCRMDENFPNALTWDPHRWNTPAAKSTNQESESSTAASNPYLPFGAGRHRCVGESFAYAQLTAILATLVKCLEWEQVDPSKPVPKTDYSSVFSRPMHPAEIRWRKRVAS